MIDFNKDIYTEVTNSGGGVYVNSITPEQIKDLTDSRARPKVTNSPGWYKNWFKVSLKRRLEFSILAKYPVGSNITEMKNL